LAAARRRLAGGGVGRPVFAVAAGGFGGVIGSMMRRGSFHDDEPPMGVADRLIGAVTWFSASKGFGFIKPGDGSDDVFVHVSVVQRAGMEGLRDGATVTCEVAPGKKGRQVTRILEVDDSTATGDLGGGGAGDGFRSAPRAPRSFGGSSFGGADAGPAGDPGEGVVKWFNATKGFGFITPDAGGKDVFLHASVVRRAGLVEVQPSQRVRYTAVEREKGPEARTLEVVGGGATVG
jgi:CspA family cold shock protein